MITSCGRIMKPDPYARLGNRSVRGVAVLVLAACVLLSGRAPVQAGWKVDAILPDLKAAGVKGALPDLDGKVVLVDFWASWCSPCKASFPVLNALQQKYAKAGLVILAINEDESPDAMRRFLQDHPVSFAVVHDVGHKVVESAAVESMPASFLVDRRGRIRHMHSGYHGDKTKQLYEQEIQALLKEALRP